MTPLTTITLACVILLALYKIFYAQIYRFTNSTAPPHLFPWSTLLNEITQYGKKRALISMSNTTSAYVLGCFWAKTYVFGKDIIKNAYEMNDKEIFKAVALHEKAHWIKNHNEAILLITLIWNLIGVGLMQIITTPLQFFLVLLYFAASAGIVRLITIRQEISADNYVVKQGYGQQLLAYYKEKPYRDFLMEKKIKNLEFQVG